MRKWLSWVVLCVMLVSCLAGAFAETAEVVPVDENLITINLQSATDEELAQLLDQIVAEQKSRIVTKHTLDLESVEIVKGKTQKLNSVLTDVADGVTVTSTVWTSSDPAVAKVQNGTVTGVGAGQATITCTAVLSDGLELDASCKVQVNVLAASLAIVGQNNITLGIGNSQNLETAIKPEDATNKKLSYESDNSNIVSVDSTGKMTAVHGGKAVITATTTDGSAKSVKVTVYVPSLSADKTEYTVTSKSGLDIELNYYGLLSNLNVSGGGSNASVSSSLSGNTLTIHVTPIKAGSTTVTVADKSDAKSKATLKVTIDHNAVYDKTSYPTIKYNDAARYPSNYKGQNVSFTGRVLQVMDGFLTNSYRISSKGRWDNVVYVTINKSALTTPIIEDDKVTVYGTYDGNYSYKALLGQTITIPSVEAERINVK